MQVFIYGSTSSFIFGDIPVLGFIPGIIALVNVVTGSARIHKISLLRSVLALIVLPIILGIILVIMLLIVVGPYFYSIFGGSSMLI